MTIHAPPFHQILDPPLIVKDINGKYIYNNPNIVVIYQCIPPAETKLPHEIIEVMAPDPLICPTLLGPGPDLLLSMLIPSPLHNIGTTTPFKGQSPHDLREAIIRWRVGVDQPQWNQITCLSHLIRVRVRYICCITGTWCRSGKFAFCNRITMIVMRYFNTS